MGIFGRGPKREHQAGVIYVYEKNSHIPPAYGVVCRCGWSTEPVIASYPDPEIEQQLASAAREHDPDADTGVAFPMDNPPGA